MQENERVGRTHFHLNGFAQRFVLTRWERTTRKWHIAKKQQQQQQKQKHRAHPTGNSFSLWYGLLVVIQRHYQNKLSFVQENITVTY